MKPIHAIITCKSALMGAYYGLTYEVCDIHPGGRVSLEINGNTVDFGFIEVFIVDLQTVAQSLYDSKKWGSSYHAFRVMPCSPKTIDLYQSLELYADRHGIKFKVQYHDAV